MKKASHGTRTPKEGQLPLIAGLNPTTPTRRISLGASKRNTVLEKYKRRLGSASFDDEYFEDDRPLLLSPSRDYIKGIKF